MEGSPTLLITFTNEDLMDTETPYDDPLAITLIVGNCEVKCILVDNGSSTNIMSLDAFTHMRFARKDLKPFEHFLFGFSGYPILLEGLITLPMKEGVTLKQITAMMEFLMVRTSTSYNAILGPFPSPITKR